MTVSTTFSKSRSSDCGCFGSGTQAGCGCRGSRPAKAFSRPNFFAGQLLTDEDLRDAMNYFVEKNRLHNRNFLGEGVVCGLRVDPHPCPESRDKVVVRSGHAINGCGDDLVLDQQEVDVSALLRDLMIKEQGRGDCDNDCDRLSDQERRELLSRLEKQETEIAKKQRDLAELIRKRQRAARSPLARVDQDANQDPNDDPEILRQKESDLRNQLECLLRNSGEVRERLKTQEFGLYIRYRETTTNYLASYATDACDPTACHGSRIQETVEFELRRASTRERVGLTSVLDECAKVISQFEVLQAKTLYGLSAIETADRIMTQFRALNSMHTEAQATADQRLAASSALLGQLEESIQEASDALEKFVENPGIRSQRSAIRQAHRMLTLGFRTLWFLDDSELQNANFAGLHQVTGELQSQLSNLDQVTGDHRVPFELLEFLLGSSGRATELLTLIESIQTGTYERPTLTFDIASRTVGEFLTSRDLSSDNPDRRTAFRDLQEVKNRLVTELQNGTIRFAPDLRDALLGVQLSLFNGNRNLTDEAAFVAIEAQAKTVGRAVAAVVRQCMCDAVIPPCPADRDSAVLLANLKIENCEVREICNLARRFVMTGPALRYWFSDFASILGPLRESCCPPSGVTFNKYLKQELDRQQELESNWKQAVHESLPNSFIPAWLAELPANPGEKKKPDYLDRRDGWKLLRHDGLELLERLAIAPANPLQELLDDPANGELSQQELNPVISQLSGAPDADLRNLLAWSDEFGSPAEVRKAAMNAESLVQEMRKNLTLVIDDKETSIADFVKGQLAEGFVGEETLAEFVRTQLAEHIGGSATLRDFVQQQLADNFAGEETLAEFVRTQLAEQIGESETLRDFVQQQLAENFVDGQPLTEFVRTQLAETFANDQRLAGFVKSQLVENVPDHELALRELVLKIARQITGKLTADEDAPELMLKEMLKAEGQGSIGWDNIRAALKRVNHDSTT